MIFPTKQSKLLSDNARTNEISRYKSQNQVQSCRNRQQASERRVKRNQLWILLNLWEKCIKFGENRRNVQKIYDSVRKEPYQDGCHCAWSLLKVTWTCPIWQSEKVIKKLNRSSCLMKFCWFGIIAQAADLDCWGCCWFPGKTCICWSACAARGFRAHERTLLHNWSCCDDGGAL